MRPVRVTLFLSPTCFFAFNGKLAAKGDIRVSRTTAENLLRFAKDRVHLDVMSYGYLRGQDEDHGYWTGLTHEDLDEFGRLDRDWAPFALWDTHLYRIEEIS